MKFSTFAAVFFLGCAALELHGVCICWQSSWFGVGMCGFATLGCAYLAKTAWKSNEEI